MLPGEGESIFKNIPLVDPLCFSRRLHVQEYKGSTNWTTWFIIKKKDKKLAVQGLDDLEKVGGGGECDQNTLNGILKLLIKLKEKYS